MPRYGRKRFSYRSRSRSRVSRPLSARRIFGNRSSRSQASQIAALNRRVSKVARASRPEKKVATDMSNTVTLDSGATGSVYTAFGDVSIGKGTMDSNRVGDCIRASTKYSFQFQYYNNSTTGFHDSESAGVTVRVVMGRFKYPSLDNTFPTLDSVFTNYGSTGENYRHIAISPLVNGITEKSVILYDKLFYLTSDKNQKVLKLKSPFVTRRYDDATSNNWSNHCWCIVIVSGLYYDDDFKEYVKVTCGRKCVFTDA